ncbi:MAG: hypothetical protein D6776_00255, partial [Planctomycetota bacterium]
LYNFYVERPADPGSNEEPLRQVLQVAPRLAADGSARTITVPGPGRANEVVLAPVTFNTSSVRISMRVLNERREDPPGSGNFLDVLRPFTAPELWFEAGTPYTGNGAALGGTGHDGTFNGYSVGDTSGLDDESLRKTVHTLRLVGLGGANNVTVHARARVPVNADGTGPVAYTSFPDVTGLSFPDTAGCVDTCVVLATDPAGNQQQYTFIDDATPPVVVLDPPLPASITGAELQIAGTADDGNPLTLTVAVDGVEVIGLASPLDVQPGHLAFDRTLCLATGVHEIVITEADTCGNATTSTYTVEATGCPANPSTGLAATVQPGGVQLSWDPVSGASGYLVFRSVDGAAFGTNPYATVSAPPFVDTAVAAGHSYSYTITSISDGSTGGPLCPTGCGTSEAVTATVGGVAGRYVFYENSAWDTTSDDDAIAPDKTALLPGNRASFANYTSYSRGINGIIIDLVNLPSASLAASDFEFRTGNDNNPDGWSLANAPTSIRVVQGAGAGGSDRVYLTWSDASAVKRAWLQVRVRAGARTGLLADDVFYFGNAIGEVGDSGWHALVNATDATATMANQRSPFSPAAIDDPYDHNRDRKVNATDVSIVQSNYTTFFNMLRLIQP